MANEIDNTALDVFIPEVWRGEALEARYERMKIWPRVLSVDALVQNFGDIVHIQVEPTVSVNNVGATGSLTNQALTPTEAQLTINKWKEATGEVVLKAYDQAIKGYVESFPRSFGKALGQQVDVDLLSLYTDVTQVQGDGTGDIGEDEIVAAISTLLNNKIPVMEEPQEMTLALYTSQWRSLKKEKVFNEAQVTGEGVGGSLKITIPNVFGIPTFFSASVQASGTVYQNLLFHRQAFAGAMQKNIDFRELPSSKLTRIFNANALYGVKTPRANHAVIIKSI